jgi:hypothetical protein
MDEFDLEVVPLQPPTTDDPARAASPRSQLVPPPFAPHLSPRARAVRAGGIVGVLLLALVVLVVVTPGARPALIGWVRGPTPAPTLTPTPLMRGYDQVAVEDQVPWGMLLIDGQPGPSLVPAQGVSLPPLPTFGLPRGSHQLEYRADPFPPLRCTLSVPAAPSDTCPLDQQPFDYLVSTGPGTRLLDLQSTVDRLPAAQVAALAQAAQQALDAAVAAAQDTLAPGDHYLGANAQVQVVVAGAVLTATPTYSLVPDTEGTATGSGSPCAPLCTAGSFAQPSATDWLLSAPVDLTWRYQTADGHVVLATGLPSPASAHRDALIQVGARWSGTGGAGGTGGTGGQWQVHVLPLNGSAGVRDPVVCAIGAHYLDVLRGTPGQSIIDFTDPSYQWPTQEWSSPSEPGCLFAGGRTVDNQGNLTGTVALVLYRYGVLLAVNAEAQRIFPHLPLPSAHEHTLALAAWPPPSTLPSAGS